MPIFTTAPPLSLYIHIPWCVQKCPYCDFNSHAMRGSALPEELYVAALLDELDQRIAQLQTAIVDRPIVSIFFGGGTPSLFSGKAIADILTGVSQRLAFATDIEITLEANPGTVEQARFYEFRAAGVNRLSIGIQSLQNDKLKTLGRIHDRDHALRAIEIARQAGFDNFNVDLMFGLPNQSIEDALHDLQTALTHNPPHLSWYQLTIEPNTLFYHQRPTLPIDDLIWEMQLAGQQLLSQHQLHQYEVSAYAIENRQCRHNLNYWEFGDYLGIGAGAHSKITDIKNNTVIRFAQVKNPRDYLEASKRRTLNMNAISDKDLQFEFMLNALRLTDGVSIQLFLERTGLPLTAIEKYLQQAQQHDLLKKNTQFICPTDSGKKFLNNLIEIFL